MKSYKIIFVISLLVIFAVFKLWLRVSAIRMAVDIKHLRKELILADSDVQQLRAKYYQLSSPSFIEQAAKEKLSMRYPKRNEIIRLVIK